MRKQRGGQNVNALTLPGRDNCNSNNRDRLGGCQPSRRAQAGQTAKNALCAYPRCEEEKEVEVTVERFLSASGELCLVLKRQGTKALILQTAHTLAPFVVPVEHVKGASVWWQGRYFQDIDNALAYFNKEIEG